jgi:hypothetical protein
VSNYSLDDQVTGVRSSAEEKYFSCSLCVQTSIEDHPASYPLRAGGPAPGVKAPPGRDADHSPCQCRDEEKVGALFPLPLVACMVAARHLYSFSFYSRKEACVKTNQQNVKQQNGGVWSGPAVFVCFSVQSVHVVNFTLQRFSRQ